MHLAQHRAVTSNLDTSINALEIELAVPHPSVAAPGLKPYRFYPCPKTSPRIWDPAWDGTASFPPQPSNNTHVNRSTVAPSRCDRAGVCVSRELSLSCRSLWEGHFLSPELRYDGCSKADDATFGMQHEHPTKGPQKMSDNKQVQSCAIFPMDQCAARYTYSGHALRGLGRRLRDISSLTRTGCTNRQIKYYVTIVSPFDPTHQKTQTFHNHPRYKPRKKLDSRSRVG